MSSFIIYKPGNNSLKQDFLSRVFEAAGDGGGFCYSEKKKLIIRKKFKKFESFWDEFNELQKKKINILIHFAEKDNATCKNYLQPFGLDGNHAFVHAGNIWKYRTSLKVENESESANLYKILKSIWNPKYFGQEYLEWVLETSLKSENKMAIMNNLGEVQIFNEKEGSMQFDCWFSESPWRFLNAPIVTSPAAKEKETIKCAEGIKFIPENNMYRIQRFCTVCDCDLTKEQLTWVQNKTYCRPCWEKTFNFHFGNTDMDTKEKDKKTNLNNFLKEIIDPEFVNVYDMF